MDTERLAGLIEQKREVLARLWQLTQRQRELVSASELTRLLGLLAAKQTLLAQLQELEQQLDPFRQEDPESRCWRSAETRERARQAAAQCEFLLGEMMRAEQDCAAELTRRRETAAQRLRAGQHTAAARAAYLQPAPGGHHQLDVSSET